VEIVPYRPEHRSELLDFLQKQFPQSPQKGVPAFFEWRFAQNPIGSSLDCYHLAIENGRIAGQLGAIRDRIWAMGRWHDCCWLVDLILAQEHRGAASTAAVRLFRTVMKKCPLLLVTGAGPKLFRFYKALRWDYREVASTYFAVRRPGPLLALAGETGEPRPLLKPILPLAGLAMSALQSARRAWRLPFTAEFEFHRLDYFGNETNDLIERLAPTFSVTSFRSSAYLNWKFNQRPEGTHFIVAARRGRGPGIDGYMTIKIMERPPHARWAEIVDFLGEPRAIDSLLDQAAKWVSQYDVDFLRLRCSLSGHRELLRGPFWIRRNRPVIDGTFFRTEDAELARYLAKEPWHLTSLVSDRTDHGADEFTRQAAVAGGNRVNDLHLKQERRWQ